jgi:hypothetical protein
VEEVGEENVVQIVVDNYSFLTFYGFLEKFEK